MRRLHSLLVIAACACTADPIVTERAPRATEAQRAIEARPAIEPARAIEAPPLHDAATDRTALLSVTLTPDGRAELIDARIKPIPFRTRNVASHGHYALEVTARDRPTTTLPLELGTPGDGAGDVVDVWTSGGTILRGPYFGAPTRYSLVRTHADGRRDVLASREVAE